MMSSLGKAKTCGSFPTDHYSFLNIDYRNGQDESSNAETTADGMFVTDILTSLSDCGVVAKPR